MKLPERISRFLCLFVFLVTTFVFSPGAEAMGASTSEQSGMIWFIPINGDIEPSMSAFVRREAGKAVSNGAEFIVFEIDTFGGRVDTALQITSFITSIKNVKTVAWVNSGETSMGVSWSAGALIALSCDSIYMAPGTSIGASAPVISSPAGNAESAGEKTVSAVRSQMASLAERNGYPVGLALAMVDYDIELSEYSVNGKSEVYTTAEYERLKNEGVQIEYMGSISPAGKLLSLTAGEAYRYGLASGLAAEKEELMQNLGVEGVIVEASPGAADAIISVLNSGAVQTLLILIGLVCIFIEINSPGFGIPGSIAVIAFLAVFVPSALLGHLGSLEIILFVLGLALLAVEIFILPGFGIVGISGILLVGFSLIFSMQDFVIPSFEWEWTLFGRNALVVFAGLFMGVVLIAVFTLAGGSKIKAFNWLVLNAKITGTAGEVDPEEEEDYASLVGKIGVTDSVLRPSGRVQIDGKIYSVESDAEFVEEGKGVKVTRVRGNRILVKRV